MPTNHHLLQQPMSGMDVLMMLANSNANSTSSSSNNNHHVASNSRKRVRADSFAEDDALPLRLADVCMMPLSILQQPPLAQFHPPLMQHQHQHQQHHHQEEEEEEEEERHPQPEAAERSVEEMALVNRLLELDERIHANSQYVFRLIDGHIDRMRAEF
jgi:hypothetical protein